jgi:hypothetical protein
VPVLAEERSEGDHAGAGKDDERSFEGIDGPDQHAGKSDYDQDARPLAACDQGDLLV